MRALVDVSEEAARAVCARDDEIDELYNSVYEDTMALMSVAPDKVRQATHMLFAAHHLERLGDRVTEHRRGRRLPGHRAHRRPEPVGAR